MPTTEIQSFLFQSIHPLTAAAPFARRVYVSKIVGEKSLKHLNSIL